MCVICISNKGVPQPTKALMMQMWKKNPHGAGYMFARGKYVYIRKGFMTFDEFYKAVRAEGFTANDTVIYHFRISTQGGINPEMCHPFILTNDLEKTKILRTRSNIGICHNGVIPVTSSSDREYSDTAHFVAEYLPWIIEKPSDLKKSFVKNEIERLICSRMAFLDYAGNVTTIGNFQSDYTGLIFSNTYFRPYVYSWVS